jgi:integrase
MQKLPEDKTVLDRCRSFDHPLVRTTLAIERCADEEWQLSPLVPKLVVNDWHSPDLRPDLTMAESSRMEEGPRRGPMSLAEFVQSRFVPEYVANKRIAGRTHFQAILKHIFPPEKAAHVFGARPTKSKIKLRAIPGWPYMDLLRLEDVTPERAQRLVATALKHGYSIQTATHMRNVLRAIFAHAITSGCLVGTNPATSVRLPAMVRKEAHALTLSQLKQVMQWMRYPEKEIALFALATGMSVAEICGLQWRYVNLSGDPQRIRGDRIPPRTIAVRAQSYRGEFRPVLEVHKRLVSIPDLLSSILLQCKSRSTSTAPDDFVIASRSGTPIYPDNIAGRRLKAIGTALEMPWLSWNVFQRTRVNLTRELGGRLLMELEKEPSLYAITARPSPGAPRRRSA